MCFCCPTSCSVAHFEGLGHVRASSTSSSGSESCSSFGRPRTCTRTHARGALSSQEQKVGEEEQWPYKESGRRAGPGVFVARLHPGRPRRLGSQTQPRALLVSGLISAALLANMHASESRFLLSNAASAPWLLAGSRPSAKTSRALAASVRWEPDAAGFWFYGGGLQPPRLLLLTTVPGVM